MGPALGVDDNLIKDFYTEDFPSTPVGYIFENELLLTLLGMKDHF